MTRGTDLPSPPVRGSVTSPPLLGLHFLELLLLVHRDARADYGLDLTPQHAVQREVRAKPVVSAPAHSEAAALVFSACACVRACVRGSVCVCAVRTHGGASVWHTVLVTRCR